jgi:hypothetical protein
MRLTLRTLLAYLDDTLEPAQTRDIGIKVSESDVARELVERIRKVVRRRSVTVPPISGPDKADANVVAEYLDNDLPSDKLAEVEEQALKSDVHLAEIAACHQLLSFIVSEPAKVPPTARQRMYGLVQGPEVDPARQAPRVASATLMAEEIVLEDENDSPLLSRRGGKKRLLAAALLSLVFLGAAWMVTRSPQAPTSPPLMGQKTEVAVLPPGDLPEKPAPPEKPVPNPPAEKLNPPMPEQPADKAAPEPPKPADQPKADPPKDDALAKARKTSEDRSEVGKHAGANGLLLQSVHDGADWQRVAAGANITGLTRLLSLPGLTNEVQLGDAVIVEIVGKAPLPELQQQLQDPPIAESAVRVFVPPANFNADVRVERGRAYLRAVKPTGATIRIRLGNDLADVTLPDDQAEIVVDQTPGAIGVVKGTAKVRVNLGTEATMKAVPGLAVWPWIDGKGWVEKPIEIGEPIASWTKQRTFNAPGRELYQDMDALVKRLPKLLNDPKKDLKLAVSELAYERSPLARRLSLFCQAALDDIPPLLDALEDQANPDARMNAVFALNLWLQRGSDHPAKLQDMLVTRRGLTAMQAERVAQLFHGFDDMALRDPRTYSQLIDGLGDDRLAIRELSFWQLSQLDPDGARAIRYTPTDPTDALRRGQQEWRRRIPEGTVPARPKN